MAVGLGGGEGGVFLIFFFLFFLGCVCVCQAAPPIKPGRLDERSDASQECASGSPSPAAKHAAREGR